MKEVNEAYDILKDGQKRAAYDQFGHEARGVAVLELHERLVRRVLARGALVRPCRSVPMHARASGLGRLAGGAGGERRATLSPSGERLGGRGGCHGPHQGLFHPQPSALGGLHPRCRSATQTCSSPQLQISSWAHLVGEPPRLGPARQRLHLVEDAAARLRRGRRALWAVLHARRPLPRRWDGDGVS